MAARHLADFSPSAYDLLHDSVRARRTVAEQEQNRQLRLDQVNALRARAAELAAAGIQPGALPILHGAMSRADLAAAQNRLNSLGRTGSSSIAPRAPGEPITTSSAPPSPVKDPLGDLPFRPSGARNSPRDLVEAKRLQMGLPSNAEAEASTAANAAITKAAGTGAVVQTPYGTVSSRGKSWQERVVEKYPEIGKEGTAANAAFVKAYKEHGMGPAKPGETNDPMQIAANIYAAKEQDPTALGGAAYADPLAGLDIRGGTAPGAPLRPASFAGVAVPPVETFDHVPPTTGQAIGQAVRSGVGGALGAVVNPLRRAGNAINRGLEVGFGTVADAANQIINPGAKSVMLPDRSGVPVTAPVATAPVEPAGLPAYNWSTPSTATPKLALDSMAPTPAPLGTMPPDHEILDSYAALDEAQRKKLLMRPAFEPFNSGRR